MTLINAEDLEFALDRQVTQMVQSPSEAEVEAVLRLDPHEELGYRLSLVKGLMVRLLKADQSIQQYLVESIRFIELHSLWKADGREDGSRFTSMTDYLPFLIDQLKQAGFTDTVGVRQMRTWLAAERVLIGNGLLTWPELHQVGIGVVEKVLQATAYNDRTGEIAEAVPEGVKKLNRQQVTDLLEEVKESPENWSVKKVAQVADEQRGVTRKRVHFLWGRDGRDEDDMLYWLEGIELHLGDQVIGGREEYFTRDEVEQIMRIVNGTSDLD